jgi:hypothetical protein
VGMMLMIAHWGKLLMVRALQRARIALGAAKPTPEGNGVAVR